MCAIKMSYIVFAYAPLKNETGVESAGLRRSNTEVQLHLTYKTRNIFNHLKTRIIR